MSLVRSKSLPGAADWQVAQEDASGTSGATGTQTTRSGYSTNRDYDVGPDNPSFASDQNSQLLGDEPSGVHSLRSCEVKEIKNGGDDPAKKATIGRHYYPEGGWGWVVLLMSLLVNITSHGLHQAMGILLIHTLREFPEATLITTSKSKNRGL